MRRTGKNGPAFALFLHPTLLLPGHGEGRLKDETTDIVALLKVRLPVFQLLVLQVGGHMGHLDVGILRVQVLWVHL